MTFHLFFLSFDLHSHPLMILRHPTGLTTTTQGNKLLLQVSAFTSPAVATFPLCSHVFHSFTSSAFYSPVSAALPLKSMNSTRTQPFPSLLYFSLSLSNKYSVFYLKCLKFFPRKLRYVALEKTFFPPLDGSRWRCPKTSNTLL